jgi:serine/threonine-protein kinase
MGTPLYMSPEQCRGSARLDHRSDIYALGCLLFHLLVGRPPFEGDTAADVIARHLLEPPPVPSTRVSRLPPDLDALVLCCLAKSPDARYQDMSELIAGVGLALPLVQSRARPLATRPAARAAAETTLVSCPPTGPAPITVVGPEPPAAGVPRPAPRTWLAMLLAALALITTATVTAAGVAGARTPASVDPMPAAAVSAGRQAPSCTGVDGALPRRRAARMPRRQPRPPRSPAAGHD